MHTGAKLWSYYTGNYGLVAGVGKRGGLHLLLDPQRLRPQRYVLARRYQNHTIVELIRAGPCPYSKLAAARGIFIARRNDSASGASI